MEIEEERRRREEEEERRRREDERKRREEEERRRREEEERNIRQPRNGNRRVIEVNTTEELMDYSPRIDQENLAPERGILKNELDKDKVNLKSAAANKLRKKNKM